MQKDQQKEALDCFARAEKIDPRNSDVYHHRGQVIKKVQGLSFHTLELTEKESGKAS